MKHSSHKSGKDCKPSRPPKTPRPWVRPPLLQRDWADSEGHRHRVPSFLSALSVASVFPPPPPIFLNPAAGRGPLLLGAFGARALLGAWKPVRCGCDPQLRSLAHQRTPAEAGGAGGRGWEGGKEVVRKSRAPQAAPEVGEGQGPDSQPRLKTTLWLTQTGCQAAPGLKEIFVFTRWVKKPPGESTRLQVANPYISFAPFPAPLPPTLAFLSMAQTPHLRGSSDSEL